MASGRRGGPAGGGTEERGRSLPARGERFDGIVVEGPLGEGGMGHLLLARDEALGRPVAVKFLRRDLVGDASSQHRFRREGRALAAVRHPHVVGVHRVGSWEGWPYIQMEFVEGEPLSVRMEAGPLPVAEALRIAEELASALAEVHARRIAHRDLSPANVLLRTGGGSVCLIDFGLSRSLDTATRESGGGMGTPYFMAPELLTGRRTGLRADVYSFGATLFAAVAGRPPHPADSTPALFHALLHDDAPPLRSLRPDAPRALEVLLARCLSRAPEFRPDDGAAILAAVRAARGGDPASAPAGAGEGTVAEGREAAAPPPPASPARAAPRDPGGTLPVFGRAAEIAALRTAVEAAEAGRGTLVLVEGDPGTGKSRILEEGARAALARASAAVRCDPAEYPGAPLRALREALAGHARSLGAATPSEILARVEGAPSGGTGAGPALRWFLDPGARAGAAPSRPDLCRAVAALLRSLLRERPAFLAVDDAHLLDEASLDLLLSVAEEVRSWPLVLAVAFRSTALDRESRPFAVRLPRLRGIAGAVPLVLGPLPGGAVASLLHLGLRLGEEDACRLAPVLHRRSGGNPLYLVECLRLLEEEGRIAEDRGGRRLRRRVTTLALPPRLREVALRRIVGLSRREREALGVASVDPAGLPAPVLAACLETREMEALRILQRLVAERGLVARSDRGFRIPHAEIREAVYADLLPELRSAYHAQAATGLEATGGAAAEPARLARHWRLGGSPARAIPLYVAAARSLREAQCPAEALALLEEARAAPGAAGTFELRVEGALLLEATGEVDAARAELRDLARSALGDERFRALTVLWGIEKDHGPAARALEILEEAAPFARTAEQKVRLAVDRAQTASKLGREAEARAALAEGEALLGPSMPAALHLALHFARGSVLWRLGDPVPAREAWKEALAAAEAAGDERMATTLLGNLSLACEDLGRRAEAIDFARRGVERASIVGATRPLAHALFQVAHLLVQDLALAEARETLRKAEDLAEGLRSDEFRVRLAGALGEFHRAAGEPGEALRRAREGLAHAAGNPRYAGSLGTLAAMAALQAGLPAEALSEGKAALEALAGAPDPSALQESGAAVAWALRALGRAGGRESTLPRSPSDWRSAEGAAVAALLAGPGAEGRALAGAARALAKTPLEARSVESLLALPPPPPPGAPATSRSGGSPRP